MSSYGCAYKVVSVGLSLLSNDGNRFLVLVPLLLLCLPLYLSTRYGMLARIIRIGMSVVSMKLTMEHG